VQLHAIDSFPVVFVPPPIKRKARLSLETLEVSETFRVLDGREGVEYEQVYARTRSPLDGLDILDPLDF
jgi:hypothetical protein